MKPSNANAQAAWTVVLNCLVEWGESLEDSIYFAICELRDRGDWTLYQRRELHGRLLRMGLKPEVATGIISRGSDEALSEVGKQAAPPELPPFQGDTHAS